MNAAAKTLTQGSLFRGEYKRLSFTKETLVLLVIVFVTLVSALAVIYVKNFDRSLVSQLQMAQRENNQLQVERSQLLLEQSTWATPARVQRIAQHRYQMIMPSQRDVQMIEI